MRDHNQADPTNQIFACDEGVLEEVQKQLDFIGFTPEEPSFFVGDWTSCLKSIPDKTKTEIVSKHRFFQDGRLHTKDADESFEARNDRWVFNSAESISIWQYVEAMPEYGIEEPTYSEDLYNVICKNNDEFALFNADGSIIFIYTRSKASKL